MTTRSIDELIAGLSDRDANERTKALGELSRHGRAAVPALTRALGDREVEVRAQAMEALAFIADPASADTFAGLVGDPDERIRANAANGLAQLGDPRALDALIATIDDDPSLIQHPTTLSASGLIGLGAAALPRVIPLLSSPQPMTRVRAYYVLQNIVEAMPGQDWPSLWRGFGSYDPMSTGDAARAAAARAWLDWITTLPGVSM